MRVADDDVPDGIEGAVAALTSAVSIAAAFQRPLVIVFGYRPAPIGGEVASMARAVRDVGERMTDEALAAVKKQDAELEAVVELVDDRPADAILRAADEHDALAIVVGATNKGRVQAASWGRSPTRSSTGRDGPSSSSPSPRLTDSD